MGSEKRFNESPHQISGYSRLDGHNALQCLRTGFRVRRGYQYIRSRGPFSAPERGADSPPAIGSGPLRTPWIPRFISLNRRLYSAWLRRLRLRPPPWPIPFWSEKNRPGRPTATRGLSARAPLPGPEGGNYTSWNNFPKAGKRSARNPKRFDTASQFSCFLSTFLEAKALAKRVRLRSFSKPRH